METEEKHHKLDVVHCCVTNKITSNKDLQVFSVMIPAHKANTTMAGSYNAKMTLNCGMPHSSFDVFYFAIFSHETVVITLMEQRCSAYL